MHAAGVCALLVLSFLAATSMTLVHPQPGDNVFSSPAHVHGASDDAADPAHVDSLGDGGDAGDGGRQDSPASDDEHHHHQVEVDAGVPGAVSAPAPARVSPARTGLGAVSAVLPDGGDRPD